jgi:hypothetical protein
MYDFAGNAFTVNVLPFGDAPNQMVRVAAIDTGGNLTLVGTALIAGATPTGALTGLALGTTTATTATSGAATLPGNPVGFLEINLSGTVRKLPYYAT